MVVTPTAVTLTSIIIKITMETILSMMSFTSQQRIMTLLPLPRVVTLALFLATSLLKEDRKEVKEDRKEVKEDRKEAKGNRKEVKEDKKEVKEDQREVETAAIIQATRTEMARAMGPEVTVDTEGNSTLMKPNVPSNLVTVTLLRNPRQLFLQ